MFQNLFSVAFRSFKEQKLSVDQAKIFCSENILKNLVNLNNFHPLSSAMLEMIDCVIKLSIVPYMKKKYPICESSGPCLRVGEMAKEVELNSLVSANYIDGCGIGWAWRESGVYNDLIMRMMNHILVKVDTPSEYEFNNKTNFDDFSQMMAGIFGIVENYDEMVLRENEHKKLVFRLIAQIAVG